MRRLLRTRISALRHQAIRHERLRLTLYRNFIELERPKERFQFSYLPKHTEVIFREALVLLFRTIILMPSPRCAGGRRQSSFWCNGRESGKLRAFDEVMAAQDIAEIDDDSFEPIKKVIFESGLEDDLPLLNRAQAGILLEILKDMFYQCFVRRGKLTRAIKVRRFFVQEGNGNLKSSA